MVESVLTTRRNFIRATGIGVGALTFGNAVTAAGATSSGQSWPQFGYDAGNTGHHPSAVAPSERVAAEWTMTTDDWTRTTVCVDDGTAFAGSSDGTLYALDAESGNERWTFEGNGARKLSPALANGLVYVPTDATDGPAIYALRPDDGAVEWRYTTKSDGVTVESSVAVAGTRLYVTQTSGDLLVLDAESGTRVASVNLSDGNTRNYTIPAVAGDMVYATVGSTLYAVDATDWSVSWTQDPGSIGGSPTAGDDRVYISTGGENSEVVALDAAGEKQWAVQTGGWSQASPTLANGRVFIGDTNGQVFAIDAESGDVMWTFTDGDGWILSQAVATEGSVLAASERGTIFCLDHATGAERWRSAFASAPGEQVEHSPPVVAADSIFIATIRGAGDKAENAGAIYRLTDTASRTTTTESATTAGTETTTARSATTTRDTSGDSSGTTTSSAGSSSVSVPGVGVAGAVTSVLAGVYFRKLRRGPSE
jgi:outer membrane protein assembly factor BamB